MRTSSTLLAVAALLAACGGGTTSPSSPSLMRVPVDGSPQLGPNDAWVTIVEFADFQCPYCGAAQPTVNQILAEYGADARLVFKHFPLPPRIHPNARPAANAAECARAQGYFWQMHDLLFENQAALEGAPLDATAFAQYASQISGLDTAAWQTCFAAGTWDARVTADEALGESLGVPGTPTFVVNGVPLVGNQPIAAFRAAVDAARTQAIASGIPRAQYYDTAILGR